MPAEVSIVQPESTTQSRAFRIKNQEKEIVLQPRARRQVEIVFSPEAPDQFQETVEINVKNNRFGTILLDTIGEGYFEDVLLTDDKGDSVDNLSFKNGSPIQETRQACFLQSMSEKQFAFEFQSSSLPKGISVIPTMGVLEPRERKEISVLFNPLEECQYEKEPMSITIKGVDHGGSTEQGLDNAPSPSPETSRLGEDQADPSYTKEMLIHVSAIAGYAEYECETRDVTFKKTAMFQVRTFTFQVRNTGSVDLHMNWTLFSATGDEKSEETIYTVIPAKAALASGESQSFQIRFAPKEVEDCSRILKACIPNRCDSTSDLVLRVDGTASRPWCHIELPPSPSLKQQWSLPYMESLSEAFSAHREDIRTIEFSSLGIKVRNTKRFKVLNPTSVPLEYVWKREREQTSMDAEGGVLGSMKESRHIATSSSKLSLFHCLTERGLIRPGLDVEMVFEFMPQEKALVESFWTLSLSGVGVTQPFVLVGQVIEPDVSLDTVNLSFGKVMCGTSVKKTIYLRNKELIPFGFVVAKKALDHSEDLESSKPQVILQPKNGIIEPQSALPIEVVYSPSQEGVANVSFFWTIRNRPSSN